MISQLDIKEKYEKELKYEKIAVIGIGSIGGYFAHNLSIIQKSLNTIVLVDPDKVTKKNLRNSIFEFKDIGKLKTTVVKEKINKDNPNISIIEINGYYNEKEIDPVIDNCDLIFDCRDRIYSRHGKIDARIYISENYVIIDCNRISIKKYDYYGSYYKQVSKYQIITAALVAGREVNNHVKFLDMLKNQRIEVYNFVNLETNKDIYTRIDIDVIFDQNMNMNISNLSQHFSTILRLNDQSDITVYLYNKLFYTNNIIIQKQTIKCCLDLDKILHRVGLYCYKKHIIAEINKNERYMILISEDGGA